MKMAGIPSIGGLLDASFPRTRESRFGLRPISLDTRFRGYDGTKVTSSLWRSSPYMYFLRSALRDRSVKSPTFVLFVSFVVMRKACNKLAFHAGSVNQ